MLHVWFIPSLSVFAGHIPCGVTSMGMIIFLESMTGHRAVIDSVDYLEKQDGVQGQHFHVHPK